MTLSVRQDANLAADLPPPTSEEDIYSPLVISLNIRCWKSIVSFARRFKLPWREAESAAGGDKSWSGVCASLRALDPNYNVLIEGNKTATHASVG